MSPAFRDFRLSTYRTQNVYICIKRMGMFVLFDSVKYRVNTLFMLDLQALHELVHALYQFIQLNLIFSTNL